MDKNKLNEFLKKVEAQTASSNSVNSQTLNLEETDETPEGLTEAEIRAIIEIALQYKENYIGSKNFIKLFDVSADEIVDDGDLYSLSEIPELFGICDYEKLLLAFGLKPYEVNTCKIYLTGRVNLSHEYSVYPFSSLEGKFCGWQTNKDYIVDLKELYDNNGSSDFRIQTKSGVDSIDLNFCVIQINDKFLGLGNRIEYVNGENVLDCFKRDNNKLFDVADSIQGTLHLDDGTITSSFTSFKAEDFVIPVNVSHYHNSGENWHMNLDVRLLPESTGSYSYKDETGKVHSFTEKFYFVDEGHKIFINKSDISIDLNGNLSYEGQEVKTQQSCDNFTLIPEIKDYINSELIDQRQSELAELDDYVKSYKQSLINYVRADVNSGLIEYAISTLDKDAFNNLFTDVGNNTKSCVMTESEALQLQSLYENFDQLRKQLAQTEFQRGQIDAQQEQLSLQKEQLAHQLNQSDRQISELEHEKVYYEKLSEDDYTETATFINQTAIEFWNDVNLKDEHGNNLDQNGKANALNKAKEKLPYKSAVHNLRLTATGKTITSKQRPLIEKQEESLDEQKHYLFLQIETIKKQLQLTEKQIALSISQARKNINVIKETFIKYFAKKAELELTVLQAPVNYLKDENGIIRGFNNEGLLCCLFDSYGNSVAMEFDALKNIVAIHDSTGKTMRFKYTNNLLESITDNRGRCIKFGYTYDTLAYVKFADDNFLEFTYDGAKIKTVTSSNGCRCIMEYDEESNKLISLCNLAQDVKTDNDYNLLYSIPYSKKIFSANIQYADKDVTITYLDDTSERFRLLPGYPFKRLKFHNTYNQNGLTSETEYFYGLYKGRYFIERTWDYGKLSDLVFTHYDDLDRVDYQTSGWKELSPTSSKKVTTEYLYDDEDRLAKKTTRELLYSDGNLKTAVQITNYLYNAQGSLILTESFTEGEQKSNGINYEERVYDENGNITKTASWNSLDASSKFYTQSDRAENGQVTAERNEKGEVSAEYEYVDGTNVVNSVKYPNGGKICYGRNPYNYDVTAITQSTEDGEANDTQTKYCRGLPVEVKSGNTTINYAYDCKGRKTSVKIDGKLQSAYAYADYSYSPETQRYILEEVHSHSLVDDTQTVDARSQRSCSAITGEMQYRELLTVNDQDVALKVYDAENKLTDTSDYVAQKYSEFSYDSLGNLNKIETAQNGKIIKTETYSYNEHGETESKIITKSSGTHTYKYSYKDDSTRRLEKINFAGIIEITPFADVNGRNTGKEIFDHGNKVAGEYVSYLKVGDHATNLPSTVWFSNGSDIKDNIRYKYDNCGNISQISVNGHISAKYRYDALNRLIREDNKELNKTVVFSYDSNGNIVSRCEYPYTSKDGEELSELSCVHSHYFYDGDRLVKRITDGEVELFEYNNLGSPTTYRNHTLVWKYGKLLRSFGDNDFIYDSFGKRIQKNKIKYTYDNDGRLIYDTYDKNFIYDETGVVAVIFQGRYYYYRKDIQGNVVALLDENGDVVVRYIYDAWGNHVVLDADGNPITDPFHIGNFNPFRYRGYYFDTETGLYYLQSRYYDPQTGRFISQDSVDYADHETINGINLYAYCKNNPVMMTDETGTMPDWLKWLLGGLAFLGAVVLTALTGGALAPVFVGMGVSIIGGGLIQGTINALNGGSFWQGFLAGAADGALWGGVFALAGASFSALKYTASAKGAVKGTKHLTTIKKGQVFDRFGNLNGKYITDVGTSASKLALPSTNSGVKFTLKATKNFRVYTGIVADAFGNTGGGVQYVMRYSINTLLKKGWLVIV